MRLSAWLRGAAEPNLEAGFDSTDAAAAAAVVVPAGDTTEFAHFASTAAADEQIDHAERETQSSYVQNYLVCLHYPGCRAGTGLPFDGQLGFVYRCPRQNLCAAT